MIEAIENVMTPQRKKGLELTTEGLLTLYTIYIAVEANKTELVMVNAVPLDTYTDNPSSRDQIYTELQSATEGLKALYDAVTQLRKEWRRAYLKTRLVVEQVPEVHCDDDGCETTLKTETRVEEYWDEPLELTRRGIDHSIINTWQSAIEMQFFAAVGAINAINQTPTFVDGYDTYRVVAKPIDKSKQNIWRTIGFGAAATGFAFYEEIASVLAKKYGSYDNLFRNFSQQKVTRRAFLKATVGFYAIKKLANWNRQFARTNSDELARIKREIKTIIENKQENTQTLCTAIYDTSKENVIATHSSIGQLKAFMGDLENQSWNKSETVLPLISNVLQASNTRHDVFNRSIEDGENSTVNILQHYASNLSADRQVGALLQTHENDLGWNSVLQVVILFAAFIGIAISNELILEVTNEVYQNFQDRA